jgi:hypothetical protein
MIARALQSVLCLCLASTLAAQQAQLCAAATAAKTGPATIAKGTEIKLELRESVSSDTAHRGQAVKLAVAADVIVAGRVVIARGTPATGVVSNLRRSVPGKINGFIDVKAAGVALPGGTSLTLRDLPPGEDDCDPIGPCWLLFTLFAPIELIGKIRENADKKKNPEAGKQMTLTESYGFSGYTPRKLTLSRAAAGQLESVLPSS